jgi:hypothetical protein
MYLYVLRHETVCTNLERDILSQMLGLHFITIPIVKIRYKQLSLNPT